MNTNPIAIMVKTLKPDIDVGEKNLSESNQQKACAKDNTNDTQHHSSHLTWPTLHLFTQRQINRFMPARPGEERSLSNLFPEALTAE